MLVVIGENMIKQKTFVIITALFLGFYSSNISFAIEDVPQPLINKYPDYACELTGQDKHEKFNRKLFVFNLKLNKYVLRPINTIWGSIMPQCAMDKLQNAYNNINFPVRVVSCAIQKDFKSSKTEFVRFLTNTTIGVGGFFDPAASIFKIEPRNEDMEQALGYKKVKPGYYWVLPVVQGNVRDLVGQLLDIPLRPTSYIPFATSAFFINSTTSSQAGIKRLDEANADPYEVARQLKGIDMYMKIANLDRKEVLKEKETELNTININNTSENIDLHKHSSTKLKADINLDNYNPQGALIDSMRSALFDNEKVDSSIWSETSLWNRTFKKRLKISSVNIDKTRPNYKYRYILQKDKTAPLAIIYPAFGEGILGDKAVREAKILYDEGYSVVIQGSAFHWEFVRSMPENYKPGIPYEDAKKLRIVSSKIINDLQIKKKCTPSKKILVGNSFGALTVLFVAAQEENGTSLGENTLNISNYFSINPPIDTFFALQQLDKHSQDWKNNPADIKLRTAVTAQKVLEVSKNKDYKNAKYDSVSLPFNNDEAKLVIGYVMKQKLYDVVFTIENCSRSKKNELYESINNMSFDDYAQKYLKKNITDKSLEQLSYDSSLYSLADFLQTNKKYKIYHSIDDYYVNQEQLIWLKNQSQNKTLLFSNGSHLGFLYRKEFLDEFKKDIMLQNTLPFNKI